MRALLVATKLLRELWREPKLLGLVIALPLVFLAIFAAAGSAPLLVTHRVLVEAQGPAAGAFVEALRREVYPDGRPTFEIAGAPERAAADEALRKGTACALVVIEEGQPPRVTVRGDAVSLQFIAASTRINRVMKRSGALVAGAPELAAVVEQPIGPTGPRTGFDAYAAGVVVFAILLIIPQTALFVAREIRWRTLGRLRLTPLRAFDLFAGVSLAQLVVAALTMALALAVAPVLGFHGRGSTIGAFAVGLALAFSAIGLGLVVGCFARNDSQAANVGGVVAMVQVFLSGSFFALPPMTVATLAGHELGPFDIFPATHGMLALRQVMLQGATLGDVGFRLAATLLLSLAYFAGGVGLFQRLRMHDGGGRGA